MTERLTVTALQVDLGVTADGKFGPLSKAALFAKMSNRSAPAITDADIEAAATDLGQGVQPAHIRAIRKIEAPRGAFDNQGRPSILYERHKFRAHSDPVGRYDAVASSISGPAYGPGGYGSFAIQYDRLAAACALDPHAAFSACSWGAFQIMGENADDIGYGSPYEMAKSLVASEAAHLECLVRFLRWKGLVAALAACRKDDPDSCIPFVTGYNGTGFRRFGYHIKFAAAL